MLENLQALAPDPILGLMAEFRGDTSPAETINPAGRAKPKIPNKT